MDTKRKNIAILAVLCACIGVFCLATPATAEGEISNVVPEVRQLNSVINDHPLEIKWMKDGNGYATIYDYNRWQADKAIVCEQAKGIANNIINKYSSVMTDEEKEKVYNYEDRMTNAILINDYYKYEEELNSFVDSIANRVPSVTSTYTTSYVSNTGDDILTKSKGVNNYNGRRETWYSQRVLPGGGLNIPGRHVREDGVIVDADGYVCVAASDLAKGTVVETSLGTAKVYDSGCAAGTTDIYVDW